MPHLVRCGTLVADCFELQQHSRIKKKRYNATYSLQIILQWIHSLRVFAYANSDIYAQARKCYSPTASVIFPLSAEKCYFAYRQVKVGII